LIRCSRCYRSSVNMGGMCKECLRYQRREPIMRAIDKLRTGGVYPILMSTLRMQLRYDGAQYKSWAKILHGQPQWLAEELARQPRALVSHPFTGKE